MTRSSCWRGFGFQRRCCRGLFSAGGWLLAAGFGYRRGCCRELLPTGGMIAGRVFVADGGVFGRRRRFVVSRRFCAEPLDGGHEGHFRGRLRLPLTQSSL